MSTENPYALNPYAAPSSAPTVEPVPEFAEYALATQGQRLGNFFVDQIATQILAFCAGIVVGVAYFLIEGPEADTESSGFQILSGAIGIGMSFAYYLVMEGTFGRTLGKLVTGTRVISVKGNPASFKQVLGRSLCRYIPFEAFSFLRADAVGWHDSIPKTRVIKAR